MPTADTIYRDSVERLPAREQLRLASLILDRLVGAGSVDVADHWSDTDLAEIARFSARRAEASGAPPLDET